MWRRNIAVLLADEYYLPHLSVGEHLQAVALAHNMESPLRTVAEELARWGLAQKADADPFTLSSGQRRRLALAATLMRPASILILDEPEQRLDTGMRAELIRRLVALKKNDKSLLCATHDPECVAALADTCLLVSEDGSITGISARDGLGFLSRLPA